MYYTNAEPEPMERYIDTLIKEIEGHVGNAKKEMGALELRGTLDKTKPESTSARKSAIANINESLRKAKEKFDVMWQKMPGVLEIVDKRCRETAKTWVDSLESHLLYHTSYEMLSLPSQLPEKFRTEWYELQQEIKKCEITTPTSLRDNTALMKRYEKFKTDMAESIATIYTEKAKKELADKQKKITEDFASINREPNRYRADAFKKQLEKLQKDLKEYHKTFKYMVLEFLGFEKDSKAKLTRVMVALGVLETLTRHELQPMTNTGTLLTGEDIAKAVDETEQQVEEMKEEIDTPPLSPYRKV